MVTEQEPAQLDADRIRLYLAELDQLLPDGSRHELIMVGGSLLALHGLRDATRDVDSIRRLDAQVQHAAAEVASRHGLAPTWLNDRAAMFWPAGLTEQMCETVIDHPRLRVLAPPLEYVFAMKLEALGLRDRDLADLRSLWPHCHFRSPDEAAQMWHSCYPHREPDPYLGAYVRDHIAR